MSTQRKVRVLLVDDEDHIRLFMSKVLTTMSAEVVAEAGNGQEAVELFRAHKPDIVLMDINMPVMNGADALRAIIKEFPRAFIIMLTSLSTADVVQDCLASGAANYIRKDLPLPEIKKQIRETWKEYVASRTSA
ncbi:MAG: response regulator transcription factor [Gammaproteobacteria bacterium]